MCRMSPRIIEIFESMDPGRHPPRLPSFLRAFLGSPMTCLLVTVHLFRPARIERLFSR
jgi:hypothetical protein